MEYEFKIEYNGLEMIFDNGFIIQELEGLDNPEIRISRDDLTGMDGGNIWARLYGMRGIAIMGSVFGDDADDFFANKRSLIRAFNKRSDDWMVITLWNGQSRRIRAKSVALPVMPIREAEVDHTQFRVEVICEDPFWRDTTEDELIATLSQPSGLEIPFILPATMGQSDSSNTVTITNTGDEDVYPYIKITGTVSNPKVTNITTGEEFEIETTIASGEFVELFVDSRGKVVLLNSTTKYWQYLTGNFIKIASGVNQLVFNANSYSAEAQLLVRYSNKYESIQ